MKNLSEWLKDQWEWAQYPIFVIGTFLLGVWVAAWK